MRIEDPSMRIEDPSLRIEDPSILLDLVTVARGNILDLTSNQPSVTYYEKVSLKLEDK